MKRLFILVLSLFTLTAHAKESIPSLTSADGKKTIQAAPVGVEGGKIVFKKGNGSRFVAALQKFSVKDQLKLKKWITAMEGDLHQQLVNKVRAAKHLKVLFVGNSYSFNIPKAFEELAKSKGKKISVKQVTRGGAPLSSHAKSAKVKEMIKTGGFDVIVIQEQSQIPSFVENQRHNIMDEAAKSIVDQAKAAGAIPVFFQTWGRRDGDKQNSGAFPNDTYVAMQARLKKGYENAAKFSGGAYIVPVGELWGVLISKDKAMGSGLYSRDGSHPSKAGVKYSAAIFFSALYDEPFKAGASQLSDKARPKPIAF